MLDDKANTEEKCKSGKQKYKEKTDHNETDNWIEK